jgi:transcriptional regulator
MYLPRHFAETDLARLDALLAAHPFVSLISLDAAGAPFVSHLPVLHRRDAAGILIEGHWARPNPQARHDGEILMIVHGPDAYVSPGVYPDKETAARVPTWNYAVAHLRGPIEHYDDEQALADLVTRLSAHFEPTVGGDWTFEPEREDHRRQLRGIVGFRFVPRTIELKFKLSQNHPPANIAAVRAAMARRDDPDAHALAELMGDE